MASGDGAGELQMAIAKVERDLLGDIDFEDRELLGPCMPAARA